MQACRSRRGLPWARDRWDQKWRSSPSSPKREEICNFFSITHWLTMTIFQVFQARVSTSVQCMTCTAITDENIKSVWVFDLHHPATGKCQSCAITRLTLKPFDCRSCWTCVTTHHKDVVSPVSSSPSVTFFFFPYLNKRTPDRDVVSHRTDIE